MTFDARLRLTLFEWFIDASFAVHPDFRSHTGGSGRFEGGLGCPIDVSAKQKLNADSSAAAELAAVGQPLPLVMWTPSFSHEQGYPVKTRMCQDNKSAIPLEKNGRASTSERTRAINMRYFMVTDYVKKGELIVECCPTDEMIGDYYAKPPQGIKFDKFRKIIVGHECPRCNENAW